MTEEEIAKLNLWQRIRGCQSDAKGVKKRGTAPKEMGGFAFVTDADVADAVRNLMSKWRIAHLVEMIDCATSDSGRTGSGKTISRADVKIRIHLVNIDQPDQRETVEWWGRGEDTQDKSIGKAGTSAVKNAWIKVLNLQGDPELDPDATDPTHGEDRAKSPSKSPRTLPDSTPQSNNLDRLRTDIKEMLREIPADRRPTREQMAEANKGPAGPERLHAMVKRIWADTADVPQGPPSILVGCPMCDDKVATKELQRHVASHHGGDLGPVPEPELIEE